MHEGSHSPRRGEPQEGVRPASKTPLDLNREAFPFKRLRASDDATLGRERLDASLLRRRQRIERALDAGERLPPTANSLVEAVVVVGAIEVAVVLNPETLGASFGIDALWKFGRTRLHVRFRPPGYCEIHPGRLTRTAMRLRAAVTGPSCTCVGHSKGVPSDRPRNPYGIHSVLECTHFPTRRSERARCTADGKPMSNRGPHV